MRKRNFCKTLAFCSYLQKAPIYIERAYERNLQQGLHHVYRKAIRAAEGTALSEHNLDTATTKNSSQTKISFIGSQDKQRN